MKFGNLRPSFSFLLTLVALLLGISGAIDLASRQMTVSVPKRDLPPYYQIRKDDLILRNYPANAFTSTPLSEPQIVGRYTLGSLPKQKPLMQEQLVEPSRIADTVAISIPATLNMVFGGTLKAGDSVDILVMPGVKEGQPPAQPVPFQNILVLDVKPVQQSSVVVIALPLNCRDNFVKVSTNATLWLTRKL